MGIKLGWKRDVARRGQSGYITVEIGNGPTMGELTFRNSDKFGDFVKFFENAYAEIKRREEAEGK